jgi:hypothetical protein
MPTEHIVALLIQERDRLNRAIEALQGPMKRRGRPPKDASPLAPTASAPARTKRRAFTAAQREQQAERMRQYWAKRKSAAKRPAKKQAKAA